MDLASPHRHSRAALRKSSLWLATHHYASRQHRQSNIYPTLMDPPNKAHRAHLIRCPVKDILQSTLESNIKEDDCPKCGHKRK